MEEPLFVADAPPDATTDLARPLVLCVDDDPGVLAMLDMALRKRYDVKLARSGEAALDELIRNPGVTVVVSDMLMPGIDGLEFLQRAGMVRPEVVRILFTGHANLNTAIAAVNQGHIFRFMTKPCAVPTLYSVIEAAVAQHGLQAAERELLERTLRGSMKALSDVLALANPTAFGRAVRVRQLASRMAAQLKLDEMWSLDVATTFWQLGLVTLPAATAERVYHGDPLSVEEEAMVARAPVVIEQLMAHIPRLELVRELLHQAGVLAEGALSEKDPRRVAAVRNARVLRAAIECDQVPAGVSEDERLQRALRTIGDLGGPIVVDAMTRLSRAAAGRQEREVRVRQLAVGAELAEDLRSDRGTLLVPRGYAVTSTFIERLRNFPPGALDKTVRVYDALAS